MARAAPAILPFLQVPTLVKLTLSHNDLRSLPEMNPIGALTSLLHLEITDQPLCALAKFNGKAVMENGRLAAQCPLAEFNGEAVTETERLAAQERFANLSKVTP
ncbi:hypothetical protein T484DRAFT_1788234 [Baffinella frigidus]|nr:hypothetical protein T484DRAFT_1788234 [Cryptophyta sp. CCMP2293]